MSRLLIQQYLAELAKLRQVSGTQRESVVREAFKDLLKAWGRAHELTFVRDTAGLLQLRFRAQQLGLVGLFP